VGKAEGVIDDEREGRDFNEVMRTGWGETGEWTGPTEWRRKL